MKSLRIGVAALAVLAFCSLSAGAQSPDGHVMEGVDQAKWGPAPPFVPPGAQIAVLAGNPMANGPYTVRLKFPAGYAVAAHSHPTDENVVVVSGTSSWEWVTSSTARPGTRSPPADSR